MLIVSISNRTDIRRKKMRKCLFIFLGESFRLGTLNRDVGSPLSYDMQRQACLSHAKLLEAVEARYSMKCDVALNTVTTGYADELLSWYPGLVASKLHSRAIGHHAMYFDTISEFKSLFTDYEFVHFIRIDLSLKNFFIDAFSIGEKLKFPCVCYLQDGAHITPSGNPRVSDVMLYVPRRLYHIFDFNVPALEHLAWDFLTSHGLDPKDIDFFTYTYHDSNSEYDWNPLYWIVNRRKSSNWISAGYHICMETLQPKPLSDEDNAKLHMMSRND